MNITLSTDLSQLLLSPPIIRNAEKVASSEASDADGNPFVIRIETTLNESLHDAKNRAYVDIPLADDAALNTIQQLDAHILDTVYENHDSKLWFGKRAPRDIIASFCNTLVMSTAKTPHPFVRCKAGYSEGQPVVQVLTASKEKPEDATTTTVSSFEELQGERVVYNIQLTGIRFCPTTFNPELKILSVQTFMNPGEYNMWDHLLNNANHSESKARILERQQRMEQFEVERLQLEELQAEVEAEVSAAIAKREDINSKYKAVVEAMEAARLECEMGVGQDSSDSSVEEAAETATETATETAADTAENTERDRMLLLTDTAEPTNTMATTSLDVVGSAANTNEKEVRFEDDATIVTDEQLMQN
jgi:hypothetical protein